MGDDLEEAYLQLIYNHKSKQHNFAMNCLEFPFFTKKTNTSLIGKLEIAKQNSLYVGLERKGRNINMRGRIKHPFSITNTQTKKQITLVNDSLLEMNLRKLKGVSEYDSEEVENYLTYDLYHILKKNGKIRVRRQRTLLKN